MLDYLIIGAGLSGSIFAYEAQKKNKTCLVIDKRNHIGGNCYTEKNEDIIVHKYGPHIFHTNNEEVWKYINQFTKFNNFINSPKAISKGKMYSLPFNMNTFYELWGTKTPAEAKEKFSNSTIFNDTPSNLAEQAVLLVGPDIFQTLILGYTEKQWGKPCEELPPEIIKRLPVRFTFNNNYFNDKYQGIPENGYTPIIEQLLKKVDVQLDCPFIKDFIKSKKIIYTGPIDEYFDYCFGRLEYRTLRFEEEILDIDNFQGNAVINYIDKDIPFTRIVEHKYFTPENQSEKTIITREYPNTPKFGDDVYYPINTQQNNELLDRYKEKANECPNVIFAGRLGEYQYLDMDKIIDKILKLCEKELK
jgi:UDP-galactopyranose mutase